MKSPAATLTPILALLALRIGSQCICARYIRPYTDNAYTWSSSEFCGFTADPDAFIADNIEFYDPHSTDGEHTATTTATASWSVRHSHSDTPLYTVTCCARSNGKPRLATVRVNPLTAARQRAQSTSTATALPEPSVYLAAGWSVDVPCAVATPARGYHYAGVKYGDECYCGTGYVGAVEAANYTSDCQMRCAGSYCYTCGGSWRMQTYRLDQ